MLRTAFCGASCFALMICACVQPEAEESAPVQTSEPRWTTLVDPSAWHTTNPADDPLDAHRPAELVCSPKPWHVVGHGTEADTGECNYISLDTALLSDIDAGQTIGIDVWWNSLASTEPAQGHLALFIGGQLLWETFVDIPGPADAQRFEFPAPFTARAGEDVTFHLHNHGFNTWTLASFAALDTLTPLP